MISFDNAHRAVHYPEDRRFRIWIRPSVLVILFSCVAIPVVIAWIEVMLYGLPRLPALPQFVEGTMSGPHGFPGWVRWTHFFNFLFLMLLIRSGLSILMDHPRLYFNDDCTPGSEWIRFTPIRVPKDRVWTAKDDARYISPVFALPGYRHTVGVARSWHFITVYGFILTGILFVVCLFTTDQWMRLVPTSWDTVTEAWSTFVYYANFHFPPEPNGFYGYNALQQIAYAATVFVMAPLSIMTGLAMSPALVNRFQWYTKFFGGRQSARSIHFLMLNGFLAFIVVHVTLIAMTGFRRNMNHIVMGRDDLRLIGMILGFVGIAVVMLSWIAAHYISWKHPRSLQHAQKAVAYPLLLASLNRFQPSEKYTREHISPHFWPNGKLPVREDWKAMAAEKFADYRLKVGGLVENPVELSLEDLRALGMENFITMHHCIQGWSGIAEWGGVPIRKLVELVRPKASAQVLAFYSFGYSLYGAEYYDTQSMENVLKAECILALEMNGAPLTETYGSPLRLRVENQLGYKMVKWIERIEFVASEADVGKGEGGSNEDDEYFDLLPNI
ncbi:MAG: molybdopterin-dependent oxidoreductase [Edaphobacter sp.]